MALAKGGVGGGGQRLTLAQQLAQLDDPPPIDFDPEDEGRQHNAEYAPMGGIEEARAEYVQVGPSKLRAKGAQVLNEPKYAGRTTSRSKLGFGGGGVGAWDDEVEDDEVDEEDEEVSDGEEEEAGGKWRRDEGEDEEDEEEDEDEGDADITDEEEEGDEDEEDDRPRRRTSKAERKGEDEDEEEREDLVNQLKAAASADVEKGRDIKKQLTMWNRLLEGRIKSQKLVSAANSLPFLDKLPSYTSTCRTEYEETLKEVEDLNESLFQIRQDLWRANNPTDSGSDLMPRDLKRKRVDNDYLEVCAEAMRAFSDRTTPFLRTTIQKWSDKVQAASGLAQSKKFKAVNQNALTQIDHAWENEREKLVLRTRSLKAPVRRVGDKRASRAEDGVEEEDVDGRDPEVFDDTDFYHALLRDIVEARMTGLDSADLADAQALIGKKQKSKKVVDPKASKGRRIRYNVHDKLQNFMTPIPTATWHEEQVEELFSSLLGKGFSRPDEDEIEEEEAVASGDEGGVGGLDPALGTVRIFG